MADYSFDPNKKVKLPKGVFLLPFIVLGIILFFKATVVIDAGEAGVLFKTLGGGVDTENPPLGEGFHVVAPWNKVYVYNTKQQEIFEQMRVLSSNGLEIAMDASIWYQPVYADLGKLHQEKGIDFLTTIVQPAVRSATRSVLGRYAPEEIYSSKREVISDEIFLETDKILSENYILLKKILVRDVTLPPTIKKAIEEKLYFEQESLGYEFKLEKARKEAERKRIEAKGIKDFQDIVSNGISDKLLRWKGIEATLELAKSSNSKVVVVGSGKDGLPLILGNN